ncbi:uncharacterized protein RHOBADRAFT_54445 [Rhodotorula graminis WP1]|uniref:Protein SQS1 n=1 Tax=Rhodotorula graminis (strain WP1) TaxID=578459 RepID=A0A0P9GKJ4_RHOGW|nr:uncharacterized protein RHOBADRAFT_54445 [Rhodotorula graminis WP1]KPV73851.1 hypothetical protein RHOBADRAFT_54445 [Rhodotorula graminis WP1]
MASFDYADLISDDMLGFNPSPVFQPPVQPAQQPGYGTPTRGARGGPARGARGGRGSPFPPRGGGSAPSSGRATPTAPAPYPTRGGGGFGGGRGGRGGRGGLGSGLGASDRGGLGGRGGMRGGGRGGAAYSGSSTPRHVVGMSSGAFNPLLVPVKFVKAAGDGLGTVGGEDEHGLELAGAASPPPPAREKHLPRHSVEGALADEVGNLDLGADADAAEHDLAPPPPETAFEPEPATTATMALDELEDAPDSAEPATHPGLGSRARKPVERAPPQAPVAVAPAAPSDDDDAAEDDDDDGALLFEISTTASAVTVDLPTSIAPPAAFASHDQSTPLSSDASDSDSEQILFPRRAQAHADPVSSARAPPAAVPRPAADLSLLASSSTTAPAAPAARSRTTHPSQPAQPAKQSKKALKRASRAARKTGRAHPRSGNAHLAGHGPGRTLADSDDDDEGDEEAGAAREERAQDREDGAALFARMQGGGSEGVDDMLVADSDDEPEQVDAQGHVPGQPRQGDSDIEWGSSSPPPVGPAGARGRAKKAAQRAQRADQRERDKLERLVAAGSTREEVELALALEVSAREDDERRRAAREHERRRAEDDYLANVDVGDEGDDSMAVLAAFAEGAVGQLGGEHGRGDDADRRMAEDEDDEDEWGTSSEGGSSSASEEEDDDEDTEGAQDRRLAQEEEDDSEELGSDDELEMEYSLGDADGRVEHSLSVDSSDDNSSIDSSLSSSTDSDAELYAFESALLAGKKISMQRMGPAGSGGRKDERERKKARARERKGKGKAHVVDSSSSDSDSNGDEVMFTGNDSWADRDEDYISQVQAAVRLNADLLSTAQGGRAARRSNRRERNKLFTAISQGNFDDIDLYDEAADLDEDLVEAMFAEQEEAGFGEPSKKQRKKDKTFNGAFSQQLAAQWDLDRSKKATKKAKRAAERAAAREAEFRDTYRDKAGSYSRGKAGAKSLARSGDDDDNDAAAINTRMRHFIVTDLSSTSMSLPPMAKKARIAVHLLAEVYGLKSRSMGSGKNRFPVLERTSKTTVVGVSERRVRAIVGTADGEHELDGIDDDWGGPRGKGKYRGKVGGLWKALEGASGKKSGGGGRRDQLGKNSEGAVVGQGADKIGEDNVGFALLKKMGWTVGGQIGLSGQGLHEPVVARVKTGKSGLGLGGGFAVSRDEAWALARGPE